MEKEILIVIKSVPFRNLNYYEGLRTAAGLWDHSVKILWSGKGVFGALNKVDNALTKKFLADLPDIDIEMYADGAALEENGFNGDDLVEKVEVAGAQKIKELIEGAEASLVLGDEMKLIVLNTNDRDILDKAMSAEADLLLMQDATLFCNSGRKDAPGFGDRKVYALKVDLEKRGFSDRMVEGVELVDYDGMVDLLFSEYAVVNL